MNYLCVDGWWVEVGRGRSRSWSMVYDVVIVWRFIAVIGWMWMLMSGRKWREGKWYENGGKKTLLTRGVDYLAGDYYFKQNIAKNNRVLKYNIARPLVLAYCQHPTSEP